MPLPPSVATGIKWALLSGTASKLAQPLFMVVLARVLAPHEFGLMGMAMVLITLVDLFQDMGFKQALVQRQTVSPLLLDTVFWGALGLGVLWCLLIFLLAPFVGTILHNDEVVPVLRTLGLLMPISTAGTVPEALLQRDLRFDRLWRADVWVALLPGFLSVSLAIAGFGVWALVYGALAGAATRMAILWLLVSWRPEKPPRKGEWRQLFRFGAWASAEAVLAWLINYSSHVLIGRYLGATSLGFYRMSHSLALMPLNSLAQAVGRVMFPVFSRIQDQPRRLGAGFEKMSRLGALTIFPVATAVAVFADPLVPLLLGERWAPTVEMVRWLAVSGALQVSLGGLNAPIYRALGRVDVMPRFLAVRAAVSVPAFWYATGHGLTAIVVTHLLLTLLFAPVNTAIAIRLFGASTRQVLAGFAVPAGLSLAALAAVWLAGRLPLPFAAGLALQLALFPLAYWALLYRLFPQRHAELAGVLRGLFRAAPD